MATEENVPLHAGAPQAGAATAEGAGGSPAPGRGGDDAAWAEVLARWGDDTAHRAYLARFSDLEGFAIAGRRYRDALAARPGDPVAARWRDEVVKRATVQGLASLPRTGPPEQEYRRAKRALLVVAAVAFGSALVAAVFRLVSGATR